MRRTLGTAVFSGMLGVTLFGIFLTPVFFFLIDWLATRSLPTPPPPTPGSPGEPAKAPVEPSSVA
jgi:multidrug efflux pump